MFHLFRKYQQPIMIVTTVIIIIAFVWLYNGTSVDTGSGSEPSYRVYGRTVTQLQVERAARRFQVAASLEMNDFLAGMAGNAMTREQAMENFVWNNFVLDHEARRLGITTTNDEVVAMIKTLSAFQTQGQFDPIKYQAAIQNFLAPNGFTETQLEDLVRDQLRLAGLKEVVVSGIDFTPEEFRILYTQNFQKMQTEVIDFKLADFTAGITPTEEEIKKYYDDHAPRLKTEEKRVVSWVRIGLDEEEQKLSGRERVAALQKHSDKATAFGQALLDGTPFAELAAREGVKLETSDEFTRTQPPAALGQAGGVAAFELTEEAPESDALQDNNGFTILHLEKVIPSRPLTLEEARARIVEAVRNEKGSKALEEKAAEVRAKVAEALKNGASFADAAAQAGVTAETLAPFSLAEPPEGGALRVEVAEKALELPEGGLSELARTPEGGVLVYLAKREPVDAEKMAAAEKEQMGPLREAKQEAAFRDWMNLRLKEADIRSFNVRQDRNAS